MTDTDFEARLARSLQARAEDAVEPFDASMIAETAMGASQPRDWRLRMVLAAAVVALAVVGTAGAIVVGGLLTQRPIPSPPLDIASPDASADPSVAPAAGRIVYTRWRVVADGEEDCDPPGVSGSCRYTSIFSSNPDGSGERLLFPEPRASLVTASADGSKLIVSTMGPQGDNLYLTDMDGSFLQLLDTRCERVRLCDGDGPFVFSPDGTRLAFARSIGGDGAPMDALGSVIAVQDLATGAVVELDSTFASNPDLGDPCHGNCGEGQDTDPSWSPDGEHLLFSRVEIGIPNVPLGPGHEFLDKTVYVVDADGGNLRQLVPTELSIRSAAWSPDGSLIVLTQSLDMFPAPDIRNWQSLHNIFVVRPDGTGLRQLTTDTVTPVGTDAPGEFGAQFPTWTRDGHIAFNRNPEQERGVYQLWVMDSDGRNVTRLDPSDPVALTAIGCISCPYPPVDPFDTGRPSKAFWIPGP
jgi:dipeptidyl aminopeptidase/acylaminoacyl peptidase